jgi:hypothetical protein
MVFTPLPPTIGTNTMLSTRTLALGLAVAAVALTPAAALARNGADDGPLHAADDHGTTVEPGDDHGMTVEPGDDNGGGVEPGDDNGGGVEPGDDNGGAVEPGDDNGGATRKAKRSAGSCTAGSHAKLKVKRSGGRLETEFEVDQNRSGAKWTVRVRRNGKSVVKTSATTKAPSGSFSVERRIGDPVGSDRIVAKATSPSGEVCTASLTI